MVLIDMLIFFKGKKIIRMSSFADQAEFIRKKKEEIFAKKRAEAANPAASSSGTKPAAPVPFANDGSFLAKFKAMKKDTKHKEIKKEPDVKPVSYANDGSFLEKFKAMQKTQDEIKREPINAYGSPLPKKPCPPPSSSSSSSTTTKNQSLMKKPPAIFEDERQGKRVIF